MKLELNLLDNEYWWGVSNTLGLKMPFGDYDFKGNTITLGQGNTASSVLLSNKGYKKITDEFLLGEDILVAPIYQKSVFRRKVQLPDGVWKADDGTVYEGNSEIEIDVPLSRLPYFIKQG